MAHISPKEVPEYIKKTSNELAYILQQHLNSYYSQEIARDRVIENMDRHVKGALRTLDEVLGFLDSDDNTYH